MRQLSRGLVELSSADCMSVAGAQGLSEYGIDLWGKAIQKTRQRILTADVSMAAQPADDFRSMLAEPDITCVSVWLI